MSERPTPTTADWARRYIQTFNLALVQLEPGTKGPTQEGWNKPGGYFTDIASAEQFWTANPRHNLGVVLGPSRVCSLDVDDVEFTRLVLLQTHGIDVDALAESYPTPFQEHRVYVRGQTATPQAVPQLAGSPEVEEGLPGRAAQLDQALASLGLRRACALVELTQLDVQQPAVQRCDATAGQLTGNRFRRGRAVVRLAEVSEALLTGVDADAEQALAAHFIILR